MMATQPRARYMTATSQRGASIQKSLVTTPAAAATQTPISTAVPSVPSNDRSANGV